VLLVLHLALASDGLHPATLALARAVTAYTSGERAEAIERLEALTSARPWDDDAHWWLARALVDAGRFDQAVSLLEGRAGRGVPTAEFRALEGIARMALHDPDGEQVVVDALPALRQGALRREALATLGVSLASRGEDGRAAGALAAAGGDPLVVLVGEVANALDASHELLAVRVTDGLPEATVGVLRGGEHWRVDLQTGLGRRVAAPPAAGDRPRCGQGTVWTHGTARSGLAGVYREQGGREERVARTPLGATDFSPTCSDGAVWFLRRVAGVQSVHRVADEAHEERVWTLGTLAALDARGDEGLLIGTVLDGEPIGYFLQELEGEPVPLWQSDLHFGVPRW